MNDDIARELIATVQILNRNVQRLVYAVGAASDKPLLNDFEFATLLGHIKPEKSGEWLKMLRRDGHIDSMRAGRLRRWHRDEAEKIAQVLINTPKETPVTRKPRMKKSA